MTTNKITEDGWHTHPEGGYQLILNERRYARIKKSNSEDWQWFAEYHPYMGHYTHTEKLEDAFAFVACRFPDHKPEPAWLAEPMTETQKALKQLGIQWGTSVWIRTCERLESERDNYKDALREMTRSSYNAMELRLIAREALSLHNVKVMATRGSEPAGSPEEPGPSGELVQTASSGSHDPACCASSLTHYAGCECHEKGWQNKWECAVEMAARVEMERDDIREMYYGLKEDHESLAGRAEKLVDALRNITSGIYSWQCCVDEIGPQAIADFYSENAKVKTRR